MLICDACGRAEDVRTVELLMVGTQDGHPDHDEVMGRTLYDLCQDCRQDVFHYAGRAREAAAGTKTPPPDAQAPVQQEILDFFGGLRAAQPIKEAWRPMVAEICSQVTDMTTQWDQLHEELGETGHVWTYILRCWRIGRNCDTVQVIVQVTRKADYVIKGWLTTEWLGQTQLNCGPVKLPLDASQGSLESAVGALARELYQPARVIDMSKAYPFPQCYTQSPASGRDAHYRGQRRRAERAAAMGERD